MKLTGGRGLETARLQLMRSIGHWEGDLIIGQGGRSAIGTLVERSTRYVMLFRLPNGRTAEHVRVALTRQVAKLPAELRRTLTWDQGKEMAEHVRFSLDARCSGTFALSWRVGVVVWIVSSRSLCSCQTGSTSGR